VNSVSDDTAPETLKHRPVFLLINANSQDERKDTKHYWTDGNVKTVRGQESNAEIILKCFKF
jgi:hypothetical protein